MRVLYKSPEKNYFDEFFDIINELYNEEINQEENQKNKKETVVLRHYNPKKIFSIPKVERILFRDPATIVWFTDGTKSVAVCGHDDIYDKETGVAICLCKRILGNKEYRELMDEWCYKKESLN